MATNGHNHDLTEGLHDLELRQVEDRAMARQTADDVASLKDDFKSFLEEYRKDREEQRVKEAKVATTIKVAKFLIPFIVVSQVLNLFLKQYGAGS